MSPKEEKGLCFQSYKIPLFLMKLYEIVEDETSNEIISWLEPNNESFIIHNCKSFSKEILPSYFKHDNFPSFIRQLNLYDFHKENVVTSGQVFCHPSFQKDKKVLLHKINRKSQLKKSAQQAQKAEERERIGHTNSKVSKKREFKLVNK